MIGFGTYQITPNTTLLNVAKALRLGYRMIDAAQYYGNEEGVGEATFNKVVLGVIWYVPKPIIGISRPLLSFTVFIWFISSPILYYFFIEIVILNIS